MQLVLEDFQLTDAQFWVMIALNKETRKREYRMRSNQPPLPPVEMFTTWYQDNWLNPTEYFGTHEPWFEYAFVRSVLHPWIKILDEGGYVCGGLLDGVKTACEELTILRLFEQVQRSDGDSRPSRRTYQFTPLGLAVFQEEYERLRLEWSAQALTHCLRDRP